MAESTEIQQIKQTQVLESVDKGQATVAGKLDKVIGALKEEGKQEAVLSEMKEQDEILLKTVKNFCWSIGVIKLFISSLVIIFNSGNSVKM